MKKFVLFLLLVSPLLAWAQVDDMYYVPKKEKKVHTVKSANDFYLAEDDAVVDEEFESDGYMDDEYADDVETAYFTNDLYEVMDDYTYSSRIVRFQSPRRLLSSSIYWDLKYNCGINDWLVYDDGYAVYIYPTANNLYYNSSYYYNRINRWNWDTFHYWGYPYYGYHNHWHRYDYHWYNPHWHQHSANIAWHPSNRTDKMPTNGSIASNRTSRSVKPVRATNGGANSRREQPTRAAGGNANPRREQQARTSSGNANPRREQQVRNVVTGNTQRRQQQVRSSANGNTTRQSSSNGTVRRSENSSSSSSSGGYSRPSSTSVSRSGSSSSSSGVRSGGSSSRGSSSGSARSSSSSGARGGSRR